MTETAQARSQLFQLIALGFAHPVEEFHRVLLNGSYALALSRLAYSSFGVDRVLAQPELAFDEFEAEHIRLFQVGRGGKPCVHLNAADCSDLSGDHSRPEFLLQYSDWYRHFGLKTSDDGQANELPDHLSCQLEFMAWLSHLEAQASNADLCRGYRRAQRDFCERHLALFLENLVAQLRQEAADSFELALAALCLECVDALVQQLLRELGTETDAGGDEIEVVNLWG